MSFNTVTSSFKVTRRRRSPLMEAVRLGLIAGAALVAFALIGAYSAMDKRAVIEGTVTLSQLASLLIVFAAGHVAARDARSGTSAALLNAVVAGLVAGACLSVLVWLIMAVNLRTTLVAASPALAKALSLGARIASLEALAQLPLIGAASALVGALVGRLPAGAGKAALTGLAAVITAGLFRDVFASMLERLPDLTGPDHEVFGSAGLNPGAAVALFFLAAAFALVRDRLALKRGGVPRSGLSRPGLVLLIAGVVLLPLVTNDFVAQVAMLVALYMLMGMGLNIELGLAGLVDLGFVAFFAVGAYTVALLCSSGPLAIADVSFWVALPVAIVLAAVAGMIFGLPVLRVRGDYLAMATLGLGEIIRVLVLSDALSPYLGGSQGIIEIDHPRLFGWELKSPVALYYLALVLAGVVAFVSLRLQNAKIGRAWLAMREDEDVAQALGIDPVASKLLAYTIGAAFAGAAGAVFAALIGSVYPHSFQLLVSINVLAILVIGGLGSLPGVLVGAIVLIGLPELLREFGEFRYLFYGIALVAMMHVRAEGLWPAAYAKEGVHAS
ncbi:branched-chain amino acid ABC transporter permease [Ancylobacter sp. 6x-1]|uniref:Branched-chain amino acid ABC transporter permease n=1 Tax=Ancylobacter crimeensis TaxID=2579147 RepID=A0ABT0DG48_9HYPH|nr:branched-chain amino acid ABC transporter permease [Ancylobacter crimeensis]MCK0198942.1 branched-chain amino acid ABC transporter permease [Ancylobacter crimeensis]